MSHVTAAGSRSELAATNREVAKSILTLLGTEEQFKYIAGDVVVEFPYGPSLGQPGRFEASRPSPTIRAG